MTLRCELARRGEGVGVALEGELGVQAFERVELGHAVFPALLRTGEGGEHLGQRLRRAALGLQARQQ